MDFRKILKSNLSNFSSLLPKAKGIEDNIEIIPYEYWRFGYSTRTQERIRDTIVPKPPEDGKREDDLKDTQKTIYHISGHSHNLFKMKEKRKSAAVYFDFSNSSIPVSDYSNCFKQLVKFSSLKYLCLRNCCLKVVPSELAKIPPTLHSIDLSYNYIETLPLDLHWEHVEGIDLSNNAFSEWPSLLSPEHFLELRVLHFKMNPIGSNVPDTLAFPTLEVLTLDNCSLTRFPPWISACNNLRILSLRGNPGITDFKPSYFVLLTHLEIANMDGIKTEEAKHKRNKSGEHDHSKKRKKHRDDRSTPSTHKRKRRSETLERSTDCLFETKPGRSPTLNIPPPPQSNMLQENDDILNKLSQEEEASTPNKSGAYSLDLQPSFSATMMVPPLDFDVTMRKRSSDSSDESEEDNMEDDSPGDQSKHVVINVDPISDHSEEEDNPQNESVFEEESCDESIGANTESPEEHPNEELRKEEETPKADDEPEDKPINSHEEEAPNAEEKEIPKEENEKEIPKEESTAVHEEEVPKNEETQKEEIPKDEQSNKLHEEEMPKTESDLPQEELLNAKEEKEEEEKKPMKEPSQDEEILPQLIVNDEGEVEELPQLTVEEVIQTKETITEMAPIGFPGSLPRKKRTMPSNFF